MNSEKQKKGKDLDQVSARQAEIFLVELANLSNHCDVILSFQKRFDEILPYVRERSPFQKAFYPYPPLYSDYFLPADDEEKYTKVFRVMEPSGINPDETVISEKPAKKVRRKRSKSTPRKMTASEVLELKAILCQVWVGRDLRTKEYALFLLQHKAILPVVIASNFPFPLPPPSPFEQCLIYLRRSIDRARYCESTDCTTRFFFAQHRNQKYCSDSCANSSQRELKRQWWAEHGKEIRAQRKASTPQKKERK